MKKLHFLTKSKWPTNRLDKLRWIRVIFLWVSVPRHTSSWVFLNAMWVLRLSSLAICFQTEQQIELSYQQGHQRLWKFKIFGDGDRHWPTALCLDFVGFEILKNPTFVGFFSGIFIIFDQIVGMRDFTGVFSWDFH